MNSEPKSIFTSKKDFEKDWASQSLPGRRSPHSVASTTPPTKSTEVSPPIVSEEGIDKETSAPTNSGEASARVRKASDAAGKNTISRGDSLTKGTDTLDKKQPLLNASQQDSNSTAGPLFRKPTLPSNLPTLAPPNTTNASKHPRSEEFARPPSTERPPKRTRPKLRPRHTLDPESFQTASAIPKKRGGSPPSPLFFSHSTRQRPILPTRFSSSEAVTAMMNKARDEPGGITTVKLARGSISNAASPPRSTSTPGSWTERSSVPRSPGTKSKSSSSLQMLTSVGIIELLEQDERPTFIIDIANGVNFNPGGPLQIVFANASLRAYESILEMVMGKTDLDSPGIAVTNDFPEFKAWALSFVKNGESLDICLPSFLYGGVTWTCSTLRKRLRLISGSSGSIVPATASTSSNGALSNSSVMSERVPKDRSGRLPRSPLAESVEASDYFGDASAPFASPASTSPAQLSSPVLPAGDDGVEPPKQAMLASQSELVTSELMQMRYPESPFFDWTRLPLSAALPRHIQFARSIDWAATPLGPIETWTFDLRAMCNLIMGSPHPAAMYWGDEYIAIYNEAYILLAGQKHPVLMGQSYKTAWAEIWPEIEGVFSNAKDSGQSTMKDDDCLFIRRNGFLEESYFSWSIIPLVGEDGSVVGIYNPAFEKTRRKIAERRMLTLREVGEKTAAARDVRGFWGQVIKGLEYNEYDVPFVFLYSVSEDSPDSDMSSMHSGSLSQAPQCILEGTLGVPNGHRAAVSPLDLKTSDEGFAPYLRESMKVDRPILLTTEDGTLSFDLIEGLEWRGFGDPCRAAVVCPIHPTTGDNILGFLVIGVNPRRPYDDDYSLFIQLLSRQLATSMASVVLFEEEIKRGQRAARLAALDRQELSKQLDLRTQEAVESETKFTRMAEFAPVGMFIANSHGQITYSNDTWWEISRHPRSENSANSWMDSIKDEDRERVEEIWKTIVDRKTAVTHEFRFKTPWQDRSGSRGDTWVLMSAYPERDEDGNLKSVFGSITNISQQKWAEDFQKRRMEEAIELKRQQENFIDMTSHEMRNPLSAILQCSDEITTSLTDYKSGDENNKSTQKLLDILDSSIDAAQTIALCAQHQKRIVDDILTLSKLDSALLTVTPVAVQPVAVVQRALKMFEGELDTNDIAMEFNMEKSYLDLEIDWVKLDPSRLLQVLINLTTNAIKFTHGQDKRTIIVSVGASRERPEGGRHNVSYFPSRSKRKGHVTDDADWGDGEVIYLHFAVQDTGRGLDDKEKTLLFQRFSQASPRTHVQYGGSGLGLFISRQLTELQGGEIGVSSERGVGSTFAFYIKSRKLEDFTPDTPIANALNSLRRNSSNAAVTLESRRNSNGKAIQRANTTGQRRASPQLTPPVSSPTPPLPTSSLDHSTLKILIVEDNLVNQRVLQKQLKNLGFQTELANHGGEALEFLKTSQFWSGRETDGVDLAVILMDLEMPVMDGLTCARTIRDYEADGTICRHVPIIAVTANARLEQIETAIASGMDDIVSKPFRMPELIPKIDELASKSNAAKSKSTSTVQNNSIVATTEASASTSKS
ncbi:related to sensory transduction histidine kinase [Phialocephala subalpina]|uniref:Related to sensory transduction histidine kinase n=1 Tax=Phialocephala subalpina TaxID=576137 RepID=A0A1L7WRD2_9HELO|nr:related to sensory transduction histidine kinase [Phialocephala subalpina]